MYTCRTNNKKGFMVISKVEIKKVVQELAVIQNIYIYYPRVYAIVIYPDTTYPIMATGKATCGPNDRWNYKLGAQIAVGRARAGIVEQLCLEEELRNILQTRSTRDSDSTREIELKTEFNKSRQRKYDVSNI